jgi:hypothetical protein
MCKIVQFITCKYIIIIIIIYFYLNRYFFIIVYSIVKELFFVNKRLFYLIVCPYLVFHKFLYVLIFPELKRARRFFFLLLH